MKPTAKVMADYCAFPVWLDAPAPFGAAMTRGEIGISTALTDALQMWNDEYDSTALNERRWSTLQNDWNARGKELAKRLAAELGTGWSVVYFDEVSEETITIS
jgi:hypothetical protein